MTTKRLPKGLVERVRRAEKVLKAREYFRLGLMKNIDYRKNDPRLRGLPSNHTDMWGRRVREFDVSKNYPHIRGVVLKRSQLKNAKMEIAMVIDRVKEHNHLFSPKKYQLIEPIAYAVGSQLILMAKTNYPSISEIAESPKGFRFFRSLQKKHAITEADLKEALNELALNTQTDLREIVENTLLVGYNQKKFIFTPLVDVM